MTSSSDSDAPARSSGPPPVPGLGSAAPPSRPQGENPAWSRRYIGREIGFRFRIVRVLATGGMGSIFLGEQSNLSRQVAIKLVRTSDADMIQRMRQEAKSLAAVSHPAIVEVHDFIAVTGSRASDCYLVMGYIPGSDLARYMDTVERGFLSPAEAVRLLLPIASALVELHARDIIHRDIKLSNIIRVVGTDGAIRSKLVDFGFARRKQDPSLTAKGIVVGTPVYFAPEIVLGQSHSPASDVYAFGVTLCKLLTGESPHGEVDIGDLLRKAVQQSVALPVWLMSTALGPLVQAMLSRDPIARPTMSEVRVGLEQCLGSLTEGDPAPVVDGERVAPSKAEAEVEAEAAPVLDGVQPSRGVGALKIALWAVSGLCVALTAAVIFFALRWAPKESSSDTNRTAVGAVTTPVPGRATPRATSSRAGQGSAAQRVRPRPVGTARIPPEPALPTVAEIRRSCQSHANMRSLYHRARKIILGRRRGNLDHAQRIMEALLPARCTPDSTRHWVSYYLTMAYVRQGKCSAARRAWTLYERFQIRRRGKAPSFPRCP